ncbi:MAG: hypothetical protein Q8S26_17005 [Azonexus sp.]|nr:hypothetical protein [Azonexus sp.]
MTLGAYRYIPAARGNAAVNADFEAFFGYGATVSNAAGADGHDRLLRPLIFTPQLTANTSMLSLNAMKDLGPVT